MGWRREKRSAQGERATVERLEPRILYSADLSPLASTVIGPQAAEQRILDDNAEFASQAEQAAQSGPHEIVFIDGRTPDYQLLVEDIAAQSGRPVEVVVLDTERDGLEQISEALAGRDDVAALHIIAHGDEGVVQLGNALVTADILQRNQGQIEAWSQALTADADILLYGCDVAATAQGKQLADTLARLTGADVSASDDATGHASLSGDWKLEYATGAIEAPVALSQSGQDAWAHLLGSITLTSYEPPFANMTDNAYEIAGGNPHAQSFTYTSGAGTYQVSQIDLVLYKNASAGGGNVNVQLRDGLGGGSTLLANGSVSRVGLGLSEGWASVSLNAPVTLTDGVTYYIRVQGTGAGNVYVGVDDAGTYADGTYFDDSDTAQPAKDMAFRVIQSDAPVVDLNGPGIGPATIGQDNMTAFTEQTSVLIAPAGTLSDPDSTNLTSLTATLAARPDGDAVESLSLNAAASTAAAGLTVSYTAATGVLSISGSASAATYQTILQGVLYGNTSDSPTTTDRTVTVVASDGATPSVARMSVISVTAVNDVPVLAGAGGTLAYSEGDAATVIDASLTISDVDDVNMESATVTISGGLVSTEDVLGFTSAFGITGSYTAGTGVLALSGSATLAQYESVLESVTYLNTNTGNPSTSARTITWVVSDGTDSSAGATSTVTVAAVNDAPVVDLNAGGAGQDVTVAFTEQTPVLVAPVAALTDVDSANLASLTVTLTARPDGNAVEFFGFNAAAAAVLGGMTVSYTATTGVLSISGPASVATYQTILQGLEYHNTSDAPTTTDRSVTVVVHDGALPSATTTSTITVTAVNEAPLNTVPGAQSVDEDTVLLIAGLSVNDVDGNLATTQLSVAGGTLNVNLAGGASISAGSNGTGTLTLSGTQAQVNAALAALSYQGNLNFNGADVLTVLSIDSAGVPLSDTDTVALGVAAVNDAPVASAGATLAYTQKGVSAVIDSTITLSDVDDTQFSGATAAIAAPVAGDTLGFVDQNGITGGFAGGVLTLSGNATPADYEAALRSVTFSTSADDPTVNNTRLTRTITWTVSDANSATAAATSSVNLVGLAAPIGIVGIIDPGLPGTTAPAATTPPPVTATAPVPSGTGTSPAAGAGGARVTIETAGSGGGLTSDPGELLFDIAQRSQTLQSASAQAGAAQRGSTASGAANAGPALGAVSADLDLGPLATAQAQASPVFVLEEFLRGGSRSAELLESLDRLRDGIDEKARQERVVNGATAAVGMSLTVGYLLWLARGGILLSSLMASLPAWRLLDPLPVLGRMSDDEDVADEDDAAMPAADTAQDAADQPRESRSA